MKTASLLMGGLVLSASFFTGCAYKTDCGIDNCGRQYVDTTYRSYENSCQNSCKVTSIPTRNTCKTCIQKEKVQTCKQTQPPKGTPILKHDKPLKISVVGQGVAPCKGACSPAQAYAMAKRAAIADAYRLIAEKVKGVYVEGDDYIKNMMVKRSVVRTSVTARIRNANIVETTFKEGLCEVEMEIRLSYADLYR